ncbi:MAG: response regulator [Desulfobacterales bacterium]|nr:response regulator [Desulfobacterales bacterium]
MEGKQNPTLLIVDDSPLSVALLEKMLRKEGYAVITARDGPQARKLAFEAKPDLIILDIMMPGEDGFKVIGHLKKNARTASIPVIFLTGRDDLNAKVAGFDLGAVDYITKPFHGPEVLARVRLHLKLSLATNSLIASQASKLKQLKEAQTSMLTEPDDLPRAHFSVYYSSLLEAGGDFYDVFPISDEMFGYFVVDVSGHNIATSYITAAVKALLKQNCTPIYGPTESMRMINDVLVEILPEGMYLTACYAKLNRRKKLLSIVNAGHPPVVYLPKDGEARLIEQVGDVLGIFNEVYYEQHDIRVSPGDRFLIYSDGLIEKPPLKKVWCECLPELLKACFHVRDIPIRSLAPELARLMRDERYQVNDDVVVVGVEV